eukprot:7391858-Alexandrium_andersonii.AAC.1
MCWTGSWTQAPQHQCGSACAACRKSPGATYRASSTTLASPGFWHWAARPAMHSGGGAGIRE